MLSDRTQEDNAAPPVPAFPGRSLINAASGVQRTLSSATTSEDLPRWKRPSAASTEVRHKANGFLLTFLARVSLPNQTYLRLSDVIVLFMSLHTLWKRKSTP